MKQQQFTVALEQPLVISQHSATAGAHHSLDYLPGATFLGVAASRLYPKLSASDAFTAFHSGQVRFGDGLPSADNEIGYPVPLSWHAFKGETTYTAGYFKADKLFDAGLNPDESQTRQPVQQRNGHVTPSGRLLNPDRQQTLKTAIDPQRGSARDSQLFGYEALNAGQNFSFTLQADDDIDDALWQQLVDALHGQARLGRSRSAQFGRVAVTAVDTPSSNAASAPADTQLTLWLASDLLLLDFGQPCLQPGPRLLGLPEGSQWHPEISFLRTRRYSPYNAYRRHYDPERQVISRGSVLRYTLPVPPDEALLQRLASGIGQHREAGLGQACVNPDLLAEVQPQFTQRHQPRTAPAVIKAPDTLLARVLQSRARAEQGKAEIAQAVQQLYDGLCQQIAPARSYYAIPAGQALPSYPGRSQWGHLRELANSHRQAPDALWQALTQGDDAVFRTREAQNRLDSASGGADTGWALRTGPGTDDWLGHWLKRKLDAHSRTQLPELVARLAVLALGEDWEKRCEGQQSHNNQEATA